MTPSMGRKEPQTHAGRLVMDALDGLTSSGTFDLVVRDIAEAEAEARAAALDEAIAAVEAEQTGTAHREDHGDGDYTIVLGSVEEFRSAVLEALRGKR